MNVIPKTPRELQVLNTIYYRTLHNLFERLSGTNPELNTQILKFIEALPSSHQAQFMNILYKLERENITVENCQKR